MSWWKKYIMVEGTTKLDHSCQSSEQMKSRVRTAADLKIDSLWCESEAEDRDWPNTREKSVVFWSISEMCQFLKMKSVEEC